MKFNQHKITIFAIIITGLILITALIFFPFEGKEKHDIGLEFIKNLIQLLLIAIIGGIIVQIHNQQRDIQKKRNDLKKELYHDFVHSYFKVKRVRRILEAGVYNKDSPTDRTMLYSIFEKEIHKLIDAQLEYESYAVYLEWLSKNDVFTDKKAANDLQIYAGQIEVYLNRLCNYYQKENPKKNEVNISGMEELNDFIFNTKVFKEKFKEHHESLKIFLKETLIKG